MKAFSVTLATLQPFKRSAEHLCEFNIGPTLLENYLSINFPALLSQCQPVQ